MKIDAIIAAYNEEKYVGNVLRTLSSCDFINQIIIVDDGSTDDTSKKIGDCSKIDGRIIYLKNEINEGKASAVIKGVDSSKAEYLILLDADLIRFTKEDLQSLMKPVLEDDYSMSVIERGDDTRGVIGWSGLSRLFGGERFLKRELFKKMEIAKEDGYKIESKMNLYCYSSKLKAITVFLPNVYAEYKFFKMNFLKGFWGYIKIGLEILTFCGLDGILKQYIALEHNRIPNVYALSKKLEYTSLKMFPILLGNMVVCSYYCFFLNLRKVFLLVT